MDIIMWQVSGGGGNPTFSSVCYMFSGRNSESLDISKAPSKSGCLALCSQTAACLEVGIIHET